MSCVHDGDLGTRWDWVSRDKSSASGWITCGRCGELVQRLAYARGRFRSQAWYLHPLLYHNTNATPKPRPRPGGNQAASLEPEPTPRSRPSAADAILRKQPGPVSPVRNKAITSSPTSLSMRASRLPSTSVATA